MLSPIQQESVSTFRKSKKEGNMKNTLSFADKPPASFKKTRDEMIGEEMYRATKIKQKELEQKGDLNNYEYCNPTNRADELPQPYKFINSILNDTIFQQVNLKIFEIEKTYKSDPNYEGNLSEFPPQGSFELNGISAINSSVKSRSNQILVGDKSGNLFILDLNKKTQICKKEITPQKRIINISSQTINYGDLQLTTISIISRGDPNVYIYRFLSGDNKLYHNYNIKIPIGLSQTASNNVTDQTKFANPLPFSAEIGINGDFISVSTYNGDVHIFQIPDPPQIPKYDSSQDDPSNQVYGSQLVGGVVQSPKRQSLTSHQRVLSGSILDMKPVDIDKAFYSIYFQGIKVNLNYKELMAKINDETFKALNPQIVAQQLLEQQLKDQAAAKEKKEVKKDVKKGAKDQGPTEQELQEKLQQEQKQQKKEILFNDVVPIPEYKVSSNGQDISEDIPLPKYIPLTKFLKTQVTLPDQKKYFARLRQFEIVTDFLITWKGSKNFELHHLRPPKMEYLISVIYDSLQKEEKQSTASETKSITLTVNSKNSKIAGGAQQQAPPPPPPPPTQQQLRSLLPPLKPKIKNTYSLIYPISCLNLNESECFAGFGLKDGTIIVWDLQFNLQKWALDRHPEEVTCLDFLENWRLVSGSKDGSVHLHDLEKGKMMMKRTNIFMEKKKYSIVSIVVSNSGLAFALDSLKNLRLYDLWHGQKIAKFQASSHLDTRTKSWTLFPQCVLNAQRDQLCILTDIHPLFEKEEEKQIQECGEIERIALKKQIIDQKVKTYDKNTNISIFRVYDILINIFPGLANVSRKGIEKEKLINLFGHLSLQDLNNPAFEIPSIGPPALGQNTQSQDITKNSSKRMSKGQFPSILKNRSRDASLNDSQAMNTQQSNTSQIQKQQQQQQKLQQQQLQQQQQLTQYVQQQKQKSTASFDSEPDLNSSFRTQLTHATHIKAIPHPQHGQKARLTKEVLHPERFLLERIRLPGQQLKDNEKDTIELCRKRFDEKEQRENRVMNDLARLAIELEKNEEKRIQRIKEIQMRQNSQPKSNGFKRSSQPIGNKTSYQ